MREFFKQLAQTPAESPSEIDEPHQKPRMLDSPQRCNAEPSPEWQLRAGPVHVASDQFEGSTTSSDTVFMQAKTKMVWQRAQLTRWR